MGLKKKTLNQQAEANTRAVKTKTELTPSGSKRKETVVKDGESLDHTPKHNVLVNNQSPKVIGVNIGITKNMGDFESLRVDCWLTDVLQETETQEQGLERLTNVALTHLTKTVEELS